MPKNYDEFISQRNRRILLVNPPYYRLFKSTYAYNKYPLSLGYLAGAIKNETDWVVTVYNADFAVTNETWEVQYLSGEGFNTYRINLQNDSHPVWNEVRNVINEFKPSVIGIYCNVGNIASAAVLAKIAKEIDKQIIVVLGGPHPTSIRKDAMRDPNVDVIVKGEGEQTIVELLKKISDGKSLESIKGIIYRTDDVIVENVNREPISDLDSLSFPVKYAKEVLKDYEKYSFSAFNSIIAARGCPYNCFFCGSRIVFSRKTRVRSVQNIVDEIKFLQKMGVRRFDFRDDTFGVNRTYLRELCRSFIKSCPGIRWECETRVDLIDEEGVKLMKKAGCEQIYIGVESGNNDILRQMRKGITIEQAILAAEVIRKHGIGLRANFIIGTPGETEQTLSDTFNAMHRISGRIAYSIFTPYPGTEAFEYCNKAGLVGNNYDASLYNHQSPENFFCASISKERFRTIASEMEKYTDKQNTTQDIKQFLSFKVVNMILGYGAFRNMGTVKSFTRSIIMELKFILRRLVSG
jgi:anaerobic magnesium-protoporphyrin IX monomethyl ester cyclase